MYQITVNAEQARVISQATEFYSRILMGQLEEIAWMTPHFKADGESHDAYIERRDKVSMLMRMAKSVYTGLEAPGANWLMRLAKIEFTGMEWPGGNFGIHNEKIPDAARIAYDIHQVVRQRIYRDENPKLEGMAKWSVHNDDPMRTSTTCTRLAKIERLPEARNVQST